MGRLRQICKGKEGVEAYAFICPGCDQEHVIYAKNPSGVEWSFNGDLDRPTFSPSLRLFRVKHPEKYCCHSFIRDGQIQYLNDCTHAMAGRTVDIPEAN